MGLTTTNLPLSLPSLHNPRAKRISLGHFVSCHCILLLPEGSKLHSLASPPMDETHVSRHALLLIELYNEELYNEFPKSFLCRQSLAFKPTLTCDKIHFRIWEIEY